MTRGYSEAIFFGHTADGAFVRIRAEYRPAARGLVASDLECVRWFYTPAEANQDWLQRSVARVGGIENYAGRDAALGGDDPN